LSGAIYSIATYCIGKIPETRNTIYEAPTIDGVLQSNTNFDIKNKSSTNNAVIESEINKDSMALDDSCKDYSGLQSTYSNKNIEYDTADKSNFQANKMSFGLGDEFNEIEGSLADIDRTIDNKNHDSITESHDKKDFPEDVQSQDPEFVNISFEQKISSNIDDPINKSDKRESINDHQNENKDNSMEDKKLEIKEKWDKKKQEMIEDMRKDRANERKEQRERRKVKT